MRGEGIRLKLEASTTSGIYGEIDAPGEDSTIWPFPVERGRRKIGCGGSKKSTFSVFNYPAPSFVPFIR
jgi:hypothetical protein